MKKPTYPAGIYWSRLYFKTSDATWAGGSTVNIVIKRDMEVLYDITHERFQKAKKTFIELPPFDVSRDELIIQKRGDDAVSFCSFFDKQIATYVFESKF